MSAVVASEPPVMQPAELFRLLADETRLRALLLMRREGELCVCELTAALDISQPKMSRHLAVLRDARLVRDRREAVWIHYRIDPGLPAWVLAAIDAACAGAARSGCHADDYWRLARMADRPGGRC